MHKGFNFSIASVTFVIFCFLWGFLIIDMLMDMKCYLIMTLICLFLMISDTDHLFMCLLAICTYSLGKCFLNPLPIFELDCLFYCC